VARLLRMRPSSSAKSSKRVAARKRRRNPARKRETSAAAGTRPLWKGTLGFGLVQVPVQLHTAESPSRIDFDLLDRRDLAPVGYRKVNKRTGEEVAQEDIVRGVKVSRERYVVVTDDEIKRAAGEAYREIAIADFVDRDAVPPVYFERPLHLSPQRGGERVYALLVHTLASTGRVGLATVMLRERESLALVMPHEKRLVLNLLRWPEDLRPSPSPAAPALPRGHERELAMARRLVEEMSGEFHPEQFKDRYRKELLALVQRRARTGERPAPPRAGTKAPRASNVVDLVALLEKSVHQTRSKPRPAARRGRSA
jgi:DNA end-binding protein Ku